jgi:hypothetical protein
MGCVPEPNRVRFPFVSNQPIEPDGTVMVPE